MKWLLRLVVFNLLLALIGIGLFWSMQSNLPKGASITDMSKILAVQIAKSRNPSLTDEQAKKIFDATPSGLGGLSQVLKAAESQRIDVLDSISDSSTAGAEQGQATGDKPKAAATPKSARQAGGVDPQVLATIQRMAIPDSMKREMIQRYLQQGAAPILPSTDVAAAKEPAPQRNTAPDLAQENAELRKQLEAVKKLQQLGSEQSAPSGERAELVKQAQESLKAIEKAQKERERQLSSSVGP